MCFEKYMKWANAKVKKMDGLDVGCVKLACFAFALLLAKFYPVFLSLDWYWYALVFVLAAYRPFKHIYMKK